jgi:tetratricopeptide (TPR) repeat protein
MKARTLLLAAALATALLTTPAAAELSELWKTCTGSDDVGWELQIKSCTAIIDSRETTQANRALAYRNRGIAHLELTYGRPIHEIGDHSKLAIDDLGTAIKLNPKDATSYLHRGIALYFAGAVRNAIADYTEAIRLDTNFSDAYFERGRAYLFLGDYKSAAANYTEMIRIDPDDVEAYRARGYVLSFLDEDQQAIADYTEAIRLDPRHGPTFTDRGKLYSVTGDLDRAIADYSEAIKVEPNNGDHYANRGFAHFYGGAFAASAADLNRAVELRPSGIVSLYAMLFRYLARRRAGEDGTSELAAEVAGWKGKNAVVELFLGRGSLEEAVNAIFTLTDRCETEFYLGQWHVIRGESAAARSRFEATAKACRRDSPHRLAAAAELKRMGP